MKKLSIVILLIFTSFSTFGQKLKELSIFQNSKNWKKEIIQFPIDWAPDLKVKGFEELLFAPKWSDVKSDDFWSLIMGWELETTSSFPLKEVEHHIKSYFDGLMIPNHWARKFPEPKVRLNKKEGSFIGTITFFDGFHTGKMITLNIRGKQYFYQKDRKAIITFRLSPKNYDNQIWNHLNEIQLKKKGNSDIILLDNSWGKEIFSFPISFAQDINYKGIAEVRFPPEGWRDPKHENFWSYTYAWNIHLNRNVDASELIKNLEMYFNGLNGVTIDDKNDHRKAIATIIEIDRKESKILFRGSVITFDRFATNKKITLNVMIESNYCKARQETTIFFKFSPKDFTHRIWKMLQNIKLVERECQQ